MKKNICFRIFLAAVFHLAALNAVSAQDGDLRFAITSAVASDSSYVNYRELTRYIAAKLGKKPVFISGLSYNEVDKLFMKGRVDVGFLCNCHYARRKAVVKFEPVAAPIIAGYGKPKFQIYVIVSKKSPLESLGDLQGKSVDFSDPLSTTTLYAAALLQEKNETIKSFFGKSIYSGSHDMTLELVASRIVDAGFIDGHIWDYHNKADPAHTSKTRIILKSRDFTIPPVVVNRNMPKAIKKQIRKTLLTMHENAEGRGILKKLRVEKFVDIKEKDYQDVLEMYNVVKNHIQ